MNRTQNCAECKFMKEYDYGKKIYYCDNEDRTDEMGKLSVGHSSEGSPVWCPLRERNYRDNRTKIDNLLTFLSCNLPIVKEWKRKNNPCNINKSMVGLGSNIDANVDLIKMRTDISLTDKMGNPIDVRVPEPEYMYEMFNAQK